VVNGHVQIVKLLLEVQASTETQDKDAASLLCHAAWDGNAEIVKMLLEAQARTMAIDKYGRTAMHRAAWMGHVEVVKHRGGENIDCHEG